MRRRKYQPPSLDRQPRVAVSTSKWAAVGDYLRPAPVRGRPRRPQATYRAGAQRGLEGAAAGVPAGQREGFAPLGLGTRVRQGPVAGHVYAQRAFETEGGDVGAALDAATVRELGQNSG